MANDPKQKKVTVISGRQLKENSLIKYANEVFVKQKKVLPLISSLCKFMAM
jgi:hypothetical protein